MRRFAIALIVLTATVAATLPVQAQSSTADGVDGFIRGEYQRAAEILTPLAELRDHVAEFFLGVMYENGYGVAPDETRACASYMQASDDLNGPFGRQADALARAKASTMSQARFRECSLLSAVGLDHGFEPAVFTLEAGHWISIDLTGATITYEGRVTRIDRPIATTRVRFLPVEHTELTVGRQRSARRHFIEHFMWQPSGPRSWTLSWRVYEVVRNEMIDVTLQQLMNVETERPPLEVDVHSLARLRVNEEGHAEWAVLSGPNAMSEGIESDAERREATERERARADAVAKVDWNRRGNPERAPTLAYVDAEGCGNLFAHAWTADRTEAITVRADKALLGLSASEPRTMDLARQPSSVELLIHVHERPVRSRWFCTDVRGHEEGTRPEEIWKATRGTVTIELSPPGVRARTPSAYRATIRIADAEFVSPSGVRVRQTRPITLTAVAGTMY